MFRQRNAAYRLGLICAAAILALAGCSSSDSEQKCKELARLGAKQYQSSQFAQSEQSYQAGVLLAKESENVLQYPLLLRELARSQLAQKKYGPAEQSLQAAINSYDDLAGKPHKSRFDQAVVDEREYETLASLGDLFLAQNKYLDAKHMYARAIALSKKIVEPPSIAFAVNQNYVVVLEKTGEHALAVEVQQKIDDSYFTTDEFDDQYAKAVTQLTRGDFSEAQKSFERLYRVSKKFVGNTNRCGKAESYLGLLQIAQNSPAQAESTLRVAIGLMPRNIENMNEICQAYALLGLARELQGDTKSGIESYRAAFAADRFLPSQILTQARVALLKFGHVQQAEVIRKRIDFFANAPQFKAIPVTALDYAILSRQQILMGKPELARQTELKGLTHLEQNSALVGLLEMRGAYQLYRRFTAAHEQELARRALKQLYLIGSRTPEGKFQLQKILQRERLPLAPPS